MKNSIFTIYQDQLILIFVEINLSLPNLITSFTDFNNSFLIENHKIVNLLKIH